MSRQLWSLALLLMACDGGGTPAVDAGGDAGALPPPRVETRDGPVIGARQEGAQAFLAIPFAAPPIGELRWRPPQAPEPWTEPLQATSRPRRCTQKALGISLSSYEDCLYLNVHTPDPMPSDAPVMVWIHGGGFIFGEGLQTDDGTAGDRLARDHGVVVVSMNYRLGAFGFLAHPELSAEGAGASGNYGIMDQRAALEWVRDNIAEFGGDPDNVTIFGESAGGFSVCLHLISAESRGLFHRAVSQSGLCESVMSPLAEVEPAGEAFAARLGCDGAPDVLACMRGKTADELLAADVAGDEVFASLSAQSWWPIVDGRFVEGELRDRVAAGDVADVPTIVGWNRDEGLLFVMLAEQDGAVADEATYMEATTALAEASGISPDAVRAQYALADYPDPGAAIGAAIGHAALACPSRRAARLLADHGSSVFVYQFAYPDASFQIPPSRDLGAFHSAEIQYIFGHPSQVGRRTFIGDDAPLHAAMSGYWTRFASGDPNGAGAVGWPAYESGSDQHLVFDRVIEASTGADAEACALWDAGR